MAKKAAAPAKGYTKAQLIAYLAEKTSLAKKDVANVLEEMNKLAYVEAKKDKGFTIPGIGKLIVVKRAARTGRNPQTGEAIKIPSKKALKFRIAKAAKDAIVPAKK
jgi:DNA-binding protein HU-beta